jgi:hypothetical protein
VDLATWLLAIGDYDKAVTTSGRKVILQYVSEKKRKERISDTEYDQLLRNFV